MQISKKARYVAFTGMLAAISSVLMFFEFPLPFLPPFLRLDLSDVPVLAGAFILGPIPAIAITLIKEIIHLSVTWSGGVGELADFLVTSTLALTAGLIYKAGKNRWASVIGSGLGILFMTVVAVFANIYILLPLYIKQGSFDVKSYIIYGVVPFNLIKGLIITIITLIIYKRLALILFKNKKT